MTSGAMPSSFSLDGRCALVTGASRGIGRAIALALDGAGARVGLVARSADDLREVAAALDHDPVVICEDLAEADAPGRVAAAALSGLGAVDELVNNAGIGIRSDSTSLTGGDIDRLHRLNVRTCCC
jgi:short-subunit dehydrogenase